MPPLVEAAILERLAEREMQMEPPSRIPGTGERSFLLARRLNAASAPVTPGSRPSR
jgi:hypothetical protein